ncbi:MAG: sterol desaturase family protein [Gammaproteobacteria bacterium]|nr:sterol desaturase family protein [Gammaproteobacteria bacterium]
MIIITVLQILCAILIGTVFFDFIHYALHRFMKAEHSVLKLLGKLHGVHHRFFPADLQIRKVWIKKNLLQHVFFEYCMTLSGIVLCLLIFSSSIVVMAGFLETCLFGSIVFSQGLDFHHRSLGSLKPYRGGVFVSTQYHAMHHVYPNHFYGSYIKLVDYLFGTALPLAGKHIVMTGAHGALGSNLLHFLKKEGAHITALQYGVDYQYDNYQRCDNALKTADILLLAHGTKHDHTQEANCDSYVYFIEQLKRLQPQRFVPLEIWAVGSEIECHPCFGIKKLYPYAQSKRNFAKFARNYFYDDTIQYRHLVHSAFTSRMGPGLMSAKFAAWITLFLLKRGFKYIPVTYTGFAWLNYLLFFNAGLPRLGRELWERSSQIVKLRILSK